MLSERRLYSHACVALRQGGRQQKAFGRGARGNYSSRTRRAVPTPRTTRRATSLPRSHSWADCRPARRGGRRDRLLRRPLIAVRNRASALGCVEQPLECLNLCFRKHHAEKRFCMSLAEYGRHSALTASRRAEPFAPSAFICVRIASDNISCSRAWTLAYKPNIFEKPCWPNFGLRPSAASHVSTHNTE